MRSSPARPSTLPAPGSRAVLIVIPWVFIISTPTETLRNNKGFRTAVSVSSIKTDQGTLSYLMNKDIPHSPRGVDQVNIVISPWVRGQMVRCSKEFGVVWSQLIPSQGGNIHSYTHTQTWAYTHTHTHTHTHILNMQACTHSDIHTYIYTHTHTHT